MPLSFTDHDLDVCARTLFAEARGEGEGGQIRVMHVLAKRVLLARAYIKKMAGRGIGQHPLFGDGTPASACLVKNKVHSGLDIYQFSCWHPADPNYPKLTKMPADDPVLTPFREIARRVLSGQETQGYTNADHYCEKHVAPNVAWTRGVEPCDMYLKHWFYNLEG
jgi:hypothetical protein